MQVSKSDILNLIYAEAEGLRNKYRSSNISQVHILCALLSLSLRGEENVKTHAETTEAIALLGCTPENRVPLLESALSTIKQNSFVTYEDVTALEDCYQLAEITASLAGADKVSAPMLVAKIAENPTHKANLLFSFKAETEQPVSAPKTVAETPINLDELFPAEDDRPKPTTHDRHPPRNIRTNDMPTPDLLDNISTIKHMQRRILGRVYGQEEAVFSVLSGYFNSIARNAEYKAQNQPRATFLFAGAPGVGKTHLAQVAARAMHLPFRRFDMSSFSDKEATLEFAGSDKVYRNGHEGLVTGFVREHPHCVLLFDEIEKAHINIIHLFLQILDAGRLKDSHTGENVLFKDAIIIMTTNAGKSLYENLEPGAPMPNRKVILNALATETNPATGGKFFPEAICSRFAAGNIVLFNPLGAQELLDIGQGCLKDYAEDFKRNFKIELGFDSHICAALLFAEGGRVDARALKGRAANFISSEVYNWIRFAYEKPEIDLSIIEKIHLRTDLSGETAELFESHKKPTVLLYSEKPDTYAHFSSSKQYRFLVPASKAQADQMIATEEIDLAICDIFGSVAATLNIEDTASSGRKLMDTLIKERIPVFIYSADDRIINSEERQALHENGASGLFEQATKRQSLLNLHAMCRRVHSEKMLRELGRARKVLSFDCTYDREGDTVGVINLTNLRIIPAIDAQDQDDIAGLEATDTTFDSIIGAEDAKAELKGFISYLKDPRTYAKNGVPAPKGIILYGPPGTGKTMLAKALAHESGATFIATQGNNFLGGKLGDGAREVRRLFAMARKYAPSVLFIDEIDIVAKDRMTSGVASDVINALLNEMDGFSSHTSRPVFVLAATNFDVSFGRQSVLDPALLRRFDRRIFVDLPDREERVAFIKTRLKASRQRLSAALVENIALRSTGMSLAELESVIDFALRSMLQRGHAALTDALFDEAFETYRFGELTNWDKDLLHRVAVHEAGHAVLSYLCGNKPSYITVAGRSNFGGYMQESGDTVHLKTKKHLLGNIRTSLAGRAAEIVVFGEEEGISTGAASDIRGATELAMRMITVYGMSDEHGIMFDSEGAARETNVRRCNAILAEQMKAAVEVLTENRDKLQALTDALITKNHLIGKDIEKILSK